jgi:hypothetical protein
MALKISMFPNPDEVSPGSDQSVRGRASRLA